MEAAGWLQLTRGRLAAARGVLEHTRRVARMEPRDELFAAALELGLARRENDNAALAAGWDRARSALVSHPVDLYTLLPLGELAVAAAQLHEQLWVSDALTEAEALLDRLGNPTLWAAPLSWARLHAGLAAGQPAEVERHAAALASGHPAGPFAAALALGAQSWVQVQSEAVDADVVLAAARRLHAVGLGWEAAHLAGRAAAISTDRRVATLLHASARAMNPTEGAGLFVVEAVPDLDEHHDESVPEPELPATPAAPVPGVAVDHDPSMLSERELEIGQLILAGLTYNQIGERLYVSAKTVEHHVARIRRRLGVSSRNELFGRLRSLLADDRPTASAG